MKKIYLPIAAEFRTDGCTTEIKKDTDASICKKCQIMLFSMNVGFFVCLYFPLSVFKACINENV